MKKLLIIILIATSAFSANLQQQLEQMAAQFHGKVSLYAHQLGTGAIVSLDPDHPVATASVIKLPIMVETYAQVKAGKHNLNETLRLTKDNQVPGSGVLAFMNPGLDLTLHDTVVLMMTLSDNTATNMVIDRIGIPAVNARTSAMGLKNTFLYKKVYKPAEGPMPADQKQFGLGKTTAREMAEVMESIQGCAARTLPQSKKLAVANGISDPQLCRQMVDIMRNQQYRNMIPHYLETVDTSETPSAIADKIGALDDVRNDVALIETTSGPIVISAFTYDIKDHTWIAENEAELLIANMAKTIVQTWAPGGLKSSATAK